MKTKFLKNMLFDILKWGSKGKGKCLTSDELCQELNKLGFQYLNSQHIGIYLSKNRFKKFKKDVLRSHFDLDDNSPPTTKVNTFFVEFKEIDSQRLDYLTAKYNPILKNLENLLQNSTGSSI